MYSLPQEIEVWYIIPAIRREFSRILTKKHGMTLEKAGMLLGVSKAAVSQYLSKKRATSFKIPEKIKKEMEKSAKIMAKNGNFAVREMIKILNLIKKERYSCRLCKKYNKGIIKQCSMKPVEGE